MMCGQTQQTVVNATLTNPGKVQNLREFNEETGINVGLISKKPLTPWYSQTFKLK